MTNVYVCNAKRLLLTPRVHFHLLMDWLTCVIIVQLKEFRQAVEDRHTHLYQNPYYPPTTQSSRNNSKCWCMYACAYLRTSFHEAMHQRVPVCSEVCTYVLQGIIHSNFCVMLHTLLNARNIKPNLNLLKQNRIQ